MSVSKFYLEEEELILLPERALFLPSKKTLILSDLHLGKINHFRKAGIPVPIAANQANTETLIKLVMQIKPDRVIFIGDLFHSHYNAEWEVVGQVVKHFSHCSFELVPGNHDIMSETQYHKHNITLHELYYPLSTKITLVHEPPANQNRSVYCLSGHIHPAVTLSGKGRQSLTFPCFWFGKHQGFLPAFGVFTGFRRIRPSEDDRVFAIVNKQVVELTSATR